MKHRTKTVMIYLTFLVLLVSLFSGGCLKQSSELSGDNMTEKKAEMGSNISNNVSNSAINYASNNVSNDLSNDENHSTDYLKMEAISLSNSKAGDSTLARNYNLETLDVELKVPSYELPLNREKITNYENFSSKVPLNESALKKLENNGFVV